MARVGILGGTFNPPHLGHLICAQEAHVRLGLQRVILVPAGHPPHKPHEADPGVHHRLELCRLAVAGDERFEVSDVEALRPGLSYTVDTLETLHAKMSSSKLYLIVGGDMAASLPTWKEPERILCLAQLAIASRRGTSRTSIRRALSSLLGGEGAEFFRMPRVDISSSEIRTRVRVREPLGYLVPAAVADYIAEHRLYAASSREKTAASV